MEPIASSLRNPYVWLGVAGTGLVAWGSANGEYAYAATGWPNAGVAFFGGLAPMPLDKIFIIVGVALLSWAWWQVRPRRGVPPIHAGTALALWSLPLLFTAPVLSMDPALYADLGWIQLQGLNPYDVGLTGAGGPFAGQVDSLWAGRGVAYPPLALLVHKAVVALAGAHPWWSIIGMRLPVLLSVAVMGWAIPRIADLLGRARPEPAPAGSTQPVAAQPPRVAVRSSQPAPPVETPPVDTSRVGRIPAPRVAVWLGLLNPLLVIHFIGGAHNDAPMLAVTLVALWLVLRFPRPVVSLVAAPILVGVAMALKQQGGLAVVAVAALPVAARLAALPLLPRLKLLGWRTAIATVVALVTFAGICVASGLGFGWLSWLDLMGAAPTPAPLPTVVKGIAWVIELVGLDSTGFQVVAGAASTLIMIAVLGWVLVRFSDRPLSALAWGALVVVVGGQALHPWYLPWALALLGLVPLTRTQRRWVYGFALGFVNWNAIQTAILHR
ncbi:MAG: hypothetical protein VB093_20590 [Propionicimonas sp.]|nr:hypothetical protein [Propionicimonas sp.]